MIKTLYQAPLEHETHFSNRLENQEEIQRRAPIHTNSITRGDKSLTTHSTSYNIRGSNVAIVERTHERRKQDGTKREIILGVAIESRTIEEVYSVKRYLEKLLVVSLQQIEGIKPAERV